MVMNWRGSQIIHTAYCSLLLAMLCSTAQARPWYSTAWNGVLHVVNMDVAPVDTAKEHITACKYLTRIFKQENTIIIKGQTPSESDMKLLQGVVAATAPGANFIDKTHTATSPVDRDIWLAGMTFALRQLSKFDSGSVTFKDNAVSIDGVTKLDENYTNVQRKLGEELPNGLLLTQTSIRPPQAKPFIWTAQYQVGVLNLTGHVPRDSDQALSAYAQSIFKGTEVRNLASVAVGAPNDWMRAAQTALDVLALAGKGNVTVQDKVIRVDAASVTPDVQERIKSYKQKLPQGFTLDINLADGTPKSTVDHFNGTALAAQTTYQSYNP